ncbi:MAG: carbohydrate ABC transporter permease [Clostridia bacterium]|nr:carbohydrate ABC transporter permease [Clostridia bacterium]
MSRVKIFNRSKRSILERRTGSAKVVFAIFFVLFVMYSITLLYPLFWMLLNSVRDVVDYNIAIATKKAFSLDIVFDFTNYVRVAEVIGNTKFSYWEMVLNSLWTTTISAFLAIFMSTVCGYCLSKYDFKLKAILYGIAIVRMILPIVGSDGAALRFYGETGLFDTPWYLILGGLGGLGGMQFLIMYGFFKNVHWAYAEAVFIDGGNDFTAFFRVMLPHAFPMMLLFFIMNFMGGWNEYMTYLIYMPSYTTLATGMYLVSNTLERTGQMPMYYAGLVLSMIPILVLFIAFSNQILTQVTIGGIKG